MNRWLSDGLWFRKSPLKNLYKLCSYLMMSMRVYQVAIFLGSLFFLVLRILVLNGTCTLICSRPAFLFSQLVVEIIIKLTDGMPWFGRYHFGLLKLFSK